jgi:hypothetical protein
MSKSARLVNRSVKLTPFGLKIGKQNHICQNAFGLRPIFTVVRAALRLQRRPASS